MINYYIKSKNALKKILKKNRNITKKEWDIYAHENGLFSANTLMFHNDIGTFEKLKEKLS